MERTNYAKYYRSLCDQCLEECKRLMRGHNLTVVPTRNLAREPIGCSLYRTDAGEELPIVALSYDEASDTFSYSHDFRVSNADLASRDCYRWCADWDGEHPDDIFAVYDWLVDRYGLPPTDPDDKGVEQPSPDDADVERLKALCRADECERMCEEAIKSHDEIMMKLAVLIYEELGGCSIPITARIEQALIGCLRTPLRICEAKFEAGHPLSNDEIAYLIATAKGCGEE